MSAKLLLLVGAIYLGVAIGFVREQRYGMALCFLGYVIGNLGLAWDAWH